MASLPFPWIKNFRKLLLVSAAALSLSSCGMYELEELRHTTPSGTPFQNQLSQLYMDYAATAERDYDWFNSWHFADKGLSLAYGKDVPPEDLNDWNIPESARPDLERARASLMSILTPDLKSVEPARTAEAQFYFDCWVKEQEQNWREEEIDNCRDNLTRALADLHAPVAHKAEAPRKMHTEVVEKKKASAEMLEKKPKKLSKPVAEKHAAPKAEPEPEAKEVREPVPESTSYAVFFEPDKAEVSEPGMNVITEVIKSLRDEPDYTVILHSSKDHPGKAAERIQVVKKLLTAGGVSDSAIHVASGKTEVEYGKPTSRRVEIFLNE